MRLQLPCPDSVPSGFVRATPAQKRWLCRAYAGDIKWSRSTNPAWTCGGNRYHRQGEDIPMQALTPRPGRSEEHTSELQSQSNLVCRLLLENNKQIEINSTTTLMLTIRQFEGFPVNEIQRT